MSPVTIMDVAVARGVVEVEGTISGGEFARVGLSILGGCQTCGATLGAYNAYPSRSGFWQCAADIEEMGFATVAEFEAFDADEAEEDEGTTYPYGDIGPLDFDGFDSLGRDPYDNPFS